MMGRLQAGQKQLFYDFCLDKSAPEEQVLRELERFLDFDPSREYLAPYYSDVGRPSIDPELTIRMLLVGERFGLCSD